MCFGLGLAGVAVAGMKGAYPVSINTTYKYAIGAIGTARNSTDNNQYLECNTQTTASGFWTYCVATDATNKTVSCTSSSANIASAVRSLNGDSALYFNWDSSGTCGTVIVYQSSYYEPKK